MDMARVWPVICQYGIGAILCTIGMWCGIRSGFVNLKISEDRRLIAMIVGGFLGMLALVCLFTFWAPYWVPEVTP